MYIVYEEVSLEELEVAGEIACDWEWEDNYDDYDALEELEITLALAEFFEELCD